jgi:hypothetical protein
VEDGTEGKYKDCRQITFPEMLSIQELKAQSKGREEEAPDQEDEATYEYALTAMIRHIGVKTDSRDYMVFCKSEERRWRFYGTDCTQDEDMKVFGENFPENETVQTPALLMSARTTDEQEIEQQNSG